MYGASICFVPCDTVRHFSYALFLRRSVPLPRVQGKLYCTSILNNHIVCILCG